MAYGRPNDPWNEGSIEDLTAKAAQPVKKAVSDAVKTVKEEVKAQVIGVPNPSGQEDQGKNNEEIKKMEEEKRKILSQTRQNLEKINQEIKKVRMDRIKKEEEKKKQEEKEKVQKKQELEQKKKEEPMWKKMLSGRTGSREGVKKMGG